MGLTRRAALLALVAVSSCGPAPSAGPPAQEVRSERRTVLLLSHIRQETLLCVPTAAAIVLAYYGDPRPPRRLKALASRKDFISDAAFHDFTVTPYREMARGVRGIGYR